MRKFLSFFVAALICTTANSQVIKLVKDINPNSGSDPKILAALPDHDILFIANNGTNGAELWRSDGTDQGTYMVKDINPGLSDGIQDIRSVFADGLLYFIARDDSHGFELWVSDGTSGGTKMVKDIFAGPTSGVYKSHMAYYNGKIYFRGCEDGPGCELWVSDGTASGTKEFKDINPGAKSSDPEWFNINNGKLFFTARTDSFGLELWMTDGTLAGTKMVKDYASGPQNTFVNAVTPKVFDGMIYAVDQNYHLVAADSTDVYVVKDIIPAQKDQVQYLFPALGAMYFCAADLTNGAELWRTDGTANGTILIKDINPGKPGSYPQALAEVNGKLLFRATDATMGYELWVTDGTTNGTQLLKDFDNSGSNGFHTIYSEIRHRLNEVNISYVKDNVYYFGADDKVHGLELWRTDGTTAGTYMIDDLATTPDKSAGSQLNYLFIDSAYIWMSMSDGKTGNELYRYRIGDTTTTAISTTIEQQSTLLYPNPGNGSFKIEINGNSFLNGYLKVTDIAGRVVYDQSINSNQRSVLVSLPYVADGTYHVTILLDNKKEVHNLTITR